VERNGAGEGRRGGEGSGEGPRKTNWCVAHRLFLWPTWPERALPNSWPRFRGGLRPYWEGADGRGWWVGWCGGGRPARLQVRGRRVRQVSLNGLSAGRMQQGWEPSRPAGGCPQGRSRSLQDKLRGVQPGPKGLPLKVTSATNCNHLEMTCGVRDTFVVNKYNTSNHPIACLAARKQVI